jgi:hypothetical protein
MFNIHDLLRKKIRQQGQTMASFAQTAQISRTYLYKIMSHKVEDPGINTLHRLAVALSLPPMALYRFYTQLPAPNSAGLLGFTAMKESNDCCLLVAETCSPDHAVMLPLEKFNKCWTLQNLGSVPWRNRFLVRCDPELIVAQRLASGQLREVSSLQLFSTAVKVPIPDAQPGEVIDVCVSFVAPQNNSSLASIWRIETANGESIYPAHCYLKACVTVFCD